MPALDTIDTIAHLYIVLPRMTSFHASDVVVLGDANIDIVFQGVSHLPRHGESVVGERYGLHIGGSAANTACAIARLDVPVQLVAGIGEDDLGDIILRRLAAVGVKTAGVSRGPEQTGITAVHTQRDHGFVAVRGAVARRPHEPRIGVLGPFRHLHIAGCHETGLPTDELGRYIQRARSHGAGVSLTADFSDQSDRGPALTDIIPLVDILFANETEIRQLAHEIDLDRSVARFSAECMVVVTLGASGALAARGDFISTSPAFAPRAVVDSTGAGDVFAGAFIVAHLAGLPLSETLKWANAAGARACERLGSGERAPRSSELASLLRAQ